MEPVSEALRIAYLRTVVTVEERPAAEAVADLGTFWVLTAHNPDSERLAGAENAARHAALCACLDELGHPWLPALGTSPDGDWSEESVAVPGLDRETALALGRQFGQAAVFEVITGELRVHACDATWTLDRPHHS